MDGSPDTGPAASWPRISDYWPDAPHRTDPQTGHWTAAAYPSEAPAYPSETPAFPNDDTLAYQRETPAYPSETPAYPREARRGLRFLLGLLAVTVFLGGSVIVLGRMVMGGNDTPAAIDAPPAPSAETPAIENAEPSPPEPNPPVSIAPAPSASATATTRPTTAPADPPFSSGTFELAGDVRVLRVSVAALGADPVRVSVPDGSGITPRLARDGSTVRLTATVAKGSDGAAPITVRLNNRITWSVQMTGGVRDATFALADALVRRIDLVGGAARLTMALPTPDETLPIRMTGGVNSWTITTVERVPVKVLLRDGGGLVVLNGDRTRGIDRGTRLRGDGDDRVESGGLAIDAVAGLGTLIVAPAGGTR